MTGLWQHRDILPGALVAGTGLTTTSLIGTSAVIGPSGDLVDTNGVCAALAGSPEDAVDA
ncbi:MAG: hypothetical protein GY798_27425 [Hyphomicrobiales bacterium]|nr:hypothetical protein [Hyphomicrobiales bacterium]